MNDFYNSVRLLSYIEYFYTSSMDVVNQLKSPVVVTWRYVDPKIEGLSSKSPTEVTYDVSDGSVRSATTLEFVSNNGLTYTDRQGAIVLTAVQKDSGEPVLINGKRSWTLDVTPKDFLVSIYPSPKINTIAISKKGLFFFSLLSFNIDLHI